MQNKSCDLCGRSADPEEEVFSFESPCLTPEIILLHQACLSEVCDRSTSLDPRKLVDFVAQRIIRCNRGITHQEARDALLHFFPTATIRSTTRGEDEEHESSLGTALKELGAGLENLRSLAIDIGNRFDDLENHIARIAQEK